MPRIAYIEKMLQFVAKNDMVGLQSHCAALAKIQAKYAERGCLLLDPTFVMNELLMDAVSLKDVNGDTINCLLRSGATQIAARRASIYAFRNNRIDLVRVLFGAGVRLDDKIRASIAYTTLEPNQQKQLEAELELANLLSLIRKKPDFHEPLSRARAGAIKNSIEKCKPVLLSFMNDITTNGNDNPMTMEQWGEFVRIISELEASQFDQEFLKKLAEYTYPNQGKARVAPPVSLLTENDIEKIKRLAHKVFLALLPSMDDDDDNNDSIPNDELNWYFKNFGNPPVGAEEKYDRIQKWVQSKCDFVGMMKNSSALLAIQDFRRERMEEAAVTFKQFVMNEFSENTDDQDFVLLGETRLELVLPEHRKLPSIDDLLELDWKKKLRREMYPICDVMLRNRKELLDAFSIDTQAWQTSMLILAARDGFTKLTQLLLANGTTDVNAKDVNNDSALIVAAQNKHNEIVDLLLSAGANVNHRGYNDFTALIWAAHNGDAKMVERLLSVTNIDLNFMDCNGNTALLYALDGEFKNIAKRLLSDDRIILQPRDAIYVPDFRRCDDLKSVIALCHDEEFIEFALKSKRLEKFQLQLVKAAAHPGREGAIQDLLWIRQQFIKRGFFVKDAEIQQRLMKLLTVDHELVLGFLKSIFDEKVRFKNWNVLCNQVLKMCEQHPDLVKKSSHDLEEIKAKLQGSLLQESADSQQSTARTKRVNDVLNEYRSATTSSTTSTAAESSVTSADAFVKIEAVREQHLASETAVSTPEHTTVVPAQLDRSAEQVEVMLHDLPAPPADLEPAAAPSSPSQAQLAGQHGFMPKPKKKAEAIAVADGGHSVAVKPGKSSSED